MSASWMFRLLFVGLLISAAGCGKTDSATSAAADSGSSPTPAASGSAVTGTESRAGTADDQDAAEVTATALNTEPDEEVEPAPGTAEWSLREIMRIRLLPLPSIDTAQTPSESTDDGTIIEASATDTAKTEAVQQVVAQTREIRRTRNQEIVKLSMDALAKTAKDPQKEAIFDAAVHHFLDAHLQLALQGDAESISALYEAAEAFYQKKPDSLAAAEAQFTLVNLAHANALRYAKAEPRWLQEFSRHAQLLATRFPKENPQALPLLLAAGRACELNGMPEEAKPCFNLITTQFPESSQATQVAGILRRLNLVGQKIEFGGPTFDGNFVTLDDYAGKTVVVVFWATHATPFVDKVAALQALGEKYKKYAQILSVNLDSEDIAIDNFIEQRNLNWPIIFHVDHDKRGWNSPLAAHYGVTSLPTLWIIDPTGTVAETDVTPDSLEERLRAVILKHRATSEIDSVEIPSRL